MSTVAKAKIQRTALDAARRAGVGRTARLLLAELVALSWPCPDGDGWAAGLPDHEPITRREIADLVGVSLRAAVDLIAELEASGVVRVDRGTGRSTSVYVLTPSTAGESPPCQGVKQAAPQGCTGLHPRGEVGCTPGVKQAAPQGDLHLSTFKIGQDTNTRADAQASPARGPGRGGGGIKNGIFEPRNAHPKPVPMTAPPIDQGADLDGRAAVVFERLTRRPSWARPGSPWISQLVARQLALVETVTLEVVDAALNGARERGRGLRNPAGFVIARVREPDMLELQREQARRRSQNERDRIDAENRLRREAEASDALAVTRELERRRAALTAKLSTDELDALIQKYIETEASPVRRGMLWARTPEERRESVMRFGEIDHLLEEAVA